MKKILSIDGGGLKGVFPVAFLASLEEKIGGNIGEYFDLIVGTSTGGIIALGLGLGVSAAELLAFYLSLGPKVFRGNRLLSALRQISIAKYSSAPLKAALKERFGDARLGESKRRLVIPSLNLLTGEVHIYKTAHHPRLATDYKVPVVDIALATSAAPSYFPTHRASDGLPLIDGGVWANNPVGFAAVEALTMLNWPAGDFKVLSLGCTSSPLDVRADSRFGWGWARWARNIADVMMAGQSSASLGMAKHLAGHDNVWRISPPVPPGRYGLDVLKELDSLRGLGNAEARTQSPYLGEFFTERAAPFAPFHEL